MRMKIKSDETLSEQSLRFLLLGTAAIIASWDIAEGFVYFLGRSNVSSARYAICALGAVFIILAGMFQMLRRINKNNISNILIDGYKMQVKVVGYEKRGIFFPKHMIKVSYAFSSDQSDKTFLTCPTHESISHLLPLGTQLDMYVDAADERYYYIDLTKYHKEEPLIKEIISSLRPGSGTGNKEIKSKERRKMKLHIMNDETLSELGMKCLYTSSQKQNRTDAPGLVDNFGPVLCRVFLLP